MKVEIVENVVRKLNSILHKRFAVNLQYIDLDSTDNKKANAASPAVETIKRNAGAPMIVAHNELIVPIRVEGGLAGIVVVDNINTLQPRDLSQIKDTVDLILTEIVAAQKRLEILTLTEDLLRSDTKNVIAFSRARALKEVVN